MLRCYKNVVIVYLQKKKNRRGKKTSQEQNV
jgi:hypothetical protein